jgi:hypothetical protein
LALRHSWRRHNRPGRLILDPGSEPAFAMKRQWLRACASPREPHQFHWKAALEVINRAANAEYLDPDKEARDSPSHAKTRIVAGILPILMVPFCLGSLTLYDRGALRMPGQRTHRTTDSYRRRASSFRPRQRSKAGKLPPFWLGRSLNWPHDPRGLFLRLNAQSMDRVALILRQP